MQILQKVILCLTGLFLLQGCAGDNAVSHYIIQKRKYTHGYHIWGQGKKQKSAEPAITVTYVIDDIVEDTVVMPESVENMILKRDSFSKPQKGLWPEKTVLPEPTIFIEALKTAPADNITGFPPANSPYAIFSVAALASALIAFFIFQSGLFIPLFLTALVLAFAARQQIKTDPGKYKAPSFATFILVFGGVLFLFLVGLVIALLFLLL